VLKVHNKRIRRIQKRKSLVKIHLMPKGRLKVMSQTKKLSKTKVPKRRSKPKSKRSIENQVRQKIAKNQERLTKSQRLSLLSHKWLTKHHLISILCSKTKS
jgi:membrane glycosyltransferase